VIISLRNILLYMFGTILFIGTSQAQSQNNIYIAAEKGDVERVNTCLSINPDVNQRDDKGNTPLISAASKGQVVVIQLLIDRGADLNAVNNSGLTALHLATSSGQVASVRLLLEKGADATLRNSTGLTALDIAQSAHNIDITGIIQSHVTAKENDQSIEDPNQRWQHNALMAISDPNGIYKRIEAHQIKQAIEDLEKSGKEEQQAWLSKATSQRTRLVRAVQLQVAAEVSFIQGMAKEENAQKIADDANGVLLVWEGRLDLVSERVRELRRQEMAQANGRTYVPSVSKSTSRPISSINDKAKNINTRNGFFEEGRLANEKEQLAGVWATSSLDNTEQLARDVNVLMLTDLGYIRTTSKEEKVSEKLLTAIDAVILMRVKRSNEVIAEIQKQRAARPALTNTGVVGPMNGRMQGRRGNQQNTQDTTIGGSRSNRRNR
jgi:uncharacterized protein